MLSIFITNPGNSTRVSCWAGGGRLLPRRDLSDAVVPVQPARQDDRAVRVRHPGRNIIGGPLCGWIIEHMNGLMNLSGWQWLFFISGPRALLIAVVIFCFRIIPIRAPRGSARRRRR